MSALVFHILFCAIPHSYCIYNLIYVTYCLWFKYLAHVVCLTMLLNAMIHSGNISVFHGFFNISNFMPCLIYIVVLFCFLFWATYCDTFHSVGFFFYLNKRTRQSY